MTLEQQQATLNRKNTEDETRKNTQEYMKAEKKKKLGKDISTATAQYFLIQN